VFYGGRPVHEFAGPQLAAGNAAATQAARFLATTPDGFLITTEPKSRELAALLPSDVGVIAEQPYFLRKGQRLVVLGHAAGAQTRSAAANYPAGRYPPAIRQ
jgi:hypothetical protein